MQCLVNFILLVTLNLQIILQCSIHSQVYVNFDNLVLYFTYRIFVVVFFFFFFFFFSFFGFRVCHWHQRGRDQDIMRLQEVRTFRDQCSTWTTVMSIASRVTVALAVRRALVITHTLRSMVQLGREDPRSTSFIVRNIARIANSILHLRNGPLDKFESFR